MRRFLAPDMPDVLGDQTGVRQILMNFEGNAIKFTEPGSVACNRALFEMALGPVH